MIGQEMPIRTHFLVNNLRFMTYSGLNLEIDMTKFSQIPK